MLLLVLGPMLVGRPSKSIGGRTAGGTCRTISVESAGTEKCSMLAGSQATFLDSVLSSCNIQGRILLMCTTRDLNDFLCSICKVMGSELS